MVDMVTALQNAERLLNYRDEETEKNADRAPTPNLLANFGVGRHVHCLPR